jgi:glycosyltransferase involved in cell wall biosynthesis
MSAGWIVLAEGNRLRWGGDLRRHHLLRALARMVGAEPANGWTVDVLRRELEHSPASPPRLASVELLDSETLTMARHSTVPTVVDLHDDPLAQLAVLGHEVTPERQAELRGLVTSNLDAFRYVIAPSREFASLVGLDSRRTLVASNGTDTRQIIPGPWQAAPVVGMVSGASPGRGIETLVESCRLLVSAIPGLRLRLALVGTTAAGRGYLEQLKEWLAEESWIAVETVPYRELGAMLAGTRVVVLPHPAGAYMDAAVPIKLFDYMAAARPIVSTPRLATAALLQRHGAGLIAAGEGPADLAEPIGRLLADEGLSRRLGVAARRAAETTYDWNLIGRRLAEDILRREEPLRWLRRRFSVIRTQLLR